MIRASRQFSDDQRQRINAAIAEAERATGAEIVPAVASASGRYDRAEDLFGLAVGVTAMGLVYVAAPRATDEVGSWGGWGSAVMPPVLGAAVVVGFAIGAWAARGVGPIVRLLTPRSAMVEEVQSAARRVFFDASVRRTGGATGVLVYVSLLERMAVVLADAAVMEAAGEEAVTGWCVELTDRLRGGDVTGALCATIGEIGEALSQTLPPDAAQNANELPDALITID